jgi:hypothetical protein
VTSAGDATQPLRRLRVVVDTNVLLRGVLAPQSASGHLLDRVDSGSALLSLSDELHREYRRVLFHPLLIAHFGTPDLKAMEEMLGRLRYGAEWVSTHGVRFKFDRDLLDLPTSRRSEGKWFRQRLHGCRVCPPKEALEDLEQSMA